MIDRLFVFLKWIWDQIKEKKWYTFLLVLSTSYLVYYRFDVYELDTINARNLIFLLWLLLLAFPLFSELEFLGIKVKKEVEKATEDVKESLQHLQSQITQVQMSNNFSPNFNFGNYPLATEKKLDELLSTFENLQQTHSKIQVTQSSTQHTQSNIQHTQSNVFQEIKDYSKDEDKSVFLFKIRLEIETTLRDICERNGYNERTSIPQMVRYLNNIRLLSDSACSLIYEVNKITTRGIHGEIVSEKYIKFVEEVYPKIMQQLTNASKFKYYTTCPRCNYSGPAPYANECPQCGYIYDDN